MNGERFVAEVKNLAEVDSNERARETVRATLETLRERLAGNEPSNLAAQLPPEVAPFVEGEGGREAFAVEEFYGRVARKEGVHEGGRQARQGGGHRAADGRDGRRARGRALPARQGLRRALRPAGVFRLERALPPRHVESLR